MKAIYPNNITSVSADTEETNYPATNVQTDMQEQVWKATSKTATLTINVDADSKGIAIFNANANSIVISIKTAGDALIESYNKTLSTYTIRNFWQEYTEQGAAHKVVIDFTAPDTKVVEVGTVHVGGVEDFAHDPKYGISERAIDYSLIKGTNNNSVHITPKKVLRQYSGRLLVQRDSEYYDVVRDFVDEVGDTIKAFALTTDDYVYWAVLGLFESPPDSTHEYYSYSNIDFTITEIA